MSTDAIGRLADALSDRYRLERELGQGGMATVYLAQDLKHDRRVAIKVLRPELAAVIGADRFLKEIKVTANLQHPHILGLIDSGAVDGLLYYVMPYVEGESLRDRLTRDTQLPVEDAVRITREVAGALDYAHRHHVIHRDIKPENILLHDGAALVADFGIALAVSAAGGTRMTETGMSLGTPHYMSPEQAMGEKEITGRSDVYALGCVLYEMLVGEPPFTGPTAQAIVARVVTEAPRPLVPQRHTIPPHVEAAVLTALEKLPADRFGSAAAFSAALEGRAETQSMRRPAGPVSTRVRHVSTRLLIGTGFLAFLLGAMATGLWLRSRPTDAAGVHASLVAPPECGFAVTFRGVPQLSPDGTRLAFLAECGTKTSLWLRGVSTGKLERMEGADGAEFPFWSPDGASLGFFSDGKLKRIDLGSMAVRSLADAPAGRGGSWNRRGSIVFAPDIYGPLMRVDAAGGVAEPATTTPDSLGRISHRNPYFLPDGERFLFSQDRPDGPGASMWLGRLGNKESREVADVTSNVAYVGGHLLYIRAGVLVSQRFDAESGTLSGAATSLVPRVETYRPRLLGNFTAAGGTMVYAEPAQPHSRIVWFDPASRREEMILPEGSYWGVALSPDRGRVLVARGAGEDPTYELWLFDLSGSTWARITDEKGAEFAFGWFPDGRRIFYADDNADRAVRVVSWTDGTVVDSISRRAYQMPLLAVAPDASYGLGRRQVEGTGFDIMRIELRGNSRAVTPVLASPANEFVAGISPDGRLLAYLSDRSGRTELMATPLPGAGVEWQLSQDGAGGTAAGPIGTIASWAADGRALYYVNGSGQLMVVEVSRTDRVQFGKPRPVAGTPANVASVETALDGRLLLMVSSGKNSAPLTVVTGWQRAQEKQ